MALTDKLTAIGEAIRDKTGKTALLTLDEMPTEIASIETGGGGGEEFPEEAFLVTGDGSYRFSNNGWNWFVENYGDRVTTQDINNCNYMFYMSRELTEIPFEINCKEGSFVSCQYMFNGCYELLSIPKINNCKADKLGSMFSNCNKIVYFPEDFVDGFDWSELDSMTSAYLGTQASMFNTMNSLREVPIGLLEHGNPSVYYGYSYFKSGFYACVNLDELVDLPIPYTATWTSNAFDSTVNYCGRLKNITFRMPDGQPYVMKWKSQTIDLCNNVGWNSGPAHITAYSDVTGITADKEVTDDATYQTLKDDPDWWTTNMAYSRYNHDSAVATINSLPDTSAYLATAGGTNTIKFRGAAGSATDGGAINTLTAEEIAVATAKGWTVTLV